MRCLLKELWVNQLRLRLMGKGSNPLSSAVATENYRNRISSLTRATSGLLHRNRCKRESVREREKGRTGRRERERWIVRKQSKRGEKHSVYVVVYQWSTDTLAEVQFTPPGDDSIWSWHWDVLPSQLMSLFFTPLPLSHSDRVLSCFPVKKKKKSKQNIP